jgi:quinol monooxygenase YgiN
MFQLGCGEGFSGRKHSAVTEVWDSDASHDASLLLPAVKNAVPQARAIVASFEKVAVTSPVWGTGLKPEQVR